MNGTVVEADPVAGAWEGLEEMRDGLRTFLARQCQDENDVEDVIQETFLRAARYRRAHRVKSLRPWTMRIALNVLADSKRRIVRTQAEPAAGEPFDPPARVEPTPGDSCYRIGGTWLDGESARELVLRALGRMRDSDRALLDSYYGGELRTRAAAEECGIARRLVKVRLYRARQRLLLALRHRATLETCWKLRAS
jgi:RNA polymerase sigma factor (sigma-70 family)